MCTEGEFAGYLEVWVEKKIDLRFQTGLVQLAYFATYITSSLLVRNNSQRNMYIEVIQKVFCQNVI